MIGVLVERGGIVGHAGLRKSQRRTYATQEIDIAINAGKAGGSFVQIHRDDARAILEACKEPVSF